MLIGRKILAGLLGLTMLVGGALLALGIGGYEVHKAHASGVTAQDFYIPSGQDPWGTALDGNGHVWLAIPGCDPAPTCSSSTPPGKIAEYNPASSSWMNTYQLPSGYAQPLFLAFDSQGKLWFPMPMNNSTRYVQPS